MRMSVCVWGGACLHAHVYACMHACVPACMHTCMCVCIHVRVHAYTCAYLTVENLLLFQGVVVQTVDLAVQIPYSGMATLKTGHTVTLDTDLIAGNA